MLVNEVINEGQCSGRDGLTALCQVSALSSTRWHSFIVLCVKLLSLGGKKQTCFVDNGGGFLISFGIIIINKSLDIINT